MHLRQTRFGYHKGQFDRVTSFATTIVERMKETEGLHSISIVKISESEGQILAYYETQEDMKKGEGLYLSALAGVLPFITLVPNAQEFEVAWMWERGKALGDAPSEPMS